MPDDPANHHGDRRPLEPGETNASRHAHNDGRGARAQTHLVNDGKGEAAGRDEPPADAHRKKRSPDSPWMGGG
jgi:hypothetical protein